MIRKYIADFIAKDRYVTENSKEKTIKSQRLIALIVAVGFLIMSIANIKENSIAMLVSTMIGFLVSFLGFLLGKIFKNDKPVIIALIIILIGILPIYVVRGGNEGFAALWLCVATYLSMYFIDFLTGFIINVFYAIMLFVVFNVPLSFVELENVAGYTPTFLLRFPLFFLINFAFSAFFMINTRTIQYELIKSRERVGKLAITDLNTGLYNRNAFIRFLNSFDNNALNTLGIIYIDANGLHELNNLKGHTAGDRFLKFIADVCKEQFEGQNIYRLGGDEFLVVAENTDLDKIQNSMSKINSLMAENNYSISYGIEYREQNINLEEMTEMANKNMLDDKANYYRSFAHDRRRNRE